MDDARRAMKALENAGVDGTTIDVRGANAEAARRPVDPEQADRRAGRYLAPRVILGVAIGAVLGALVGVGVGLVVVAVADVSASGATVAMCAVAGALLGAVVGAFLSVERSVGLSEDWPLTFDDAGSGPVWVTVSTREPDVAKKARSTLERVGAAEVRSGP